MSKGNITQPPLISEANDQCSAGPKLIEVDYQGIRLGRFHHVQASLSSSRSGRALARPILTGRFLAGMDGDAAHHSLSRRATLARVGKSLSLSGQAQVARSAIVLTTA